MTFDELIAVSGINGLFKVITNKSNGLIVKDIDSGKSKFVSARKYQFTPMASIAIYTYEDSTPIREVFTLMYNALSKHPLPAISDGPEVLREYFRKVMEDHDESRVHTGDIKKVVRWFSYLNNNGLSDLFLKNDEDEKDEAAQ